MPCGETTNLATSFRQHSILHHFTLPSQESMRLHISPPPIESLQGHTQGIRRCFDTDFPRAGLYLRDSLTGKVQESAMNMIRGIKVSIFCALVSGCATTGSTDKSETLDQLGHYSAGRLIACDAAQWVSPELAIKHTMDFALAREELQHPGQCGPGCVRDLEVWRRGAEDGASCR